MPVMTPQEAIKRGRDAFVRKTLDVEMRIEAELQEKAFKGSPVFVDFYMNKPDHDVLQAVLLKFREAGWIVKAQGSGYTFEPESAPR